MEYEPFYVFLIHLLDSQMDPSSVVICMHVVSVALVRLMLRVVIHHLHCLSIISLFWLCHFPNTVKYEVLESITFSLLMLVCGVFCEQYETVQGIHV